MGKQKKDLFSVLGDDIMKAVVNRLVPKPRGKGRPKKVSWNDRLTNVVTTSTVALPALGALVLVNKGAITDEHMWMVIHYVTAKRESLSIPELYPTSPNWVVKRALEEFGLDVSGISVTWDEIMSLAAYMAQGFALIQEQQKAGRVQPPLVQPPVSQQPADPLPVATPAEVEQIMKSVRRIPGFNTAFSRFMNPVTAPGKQKPAEKKAAPDKVVDKTGGDQVK